MLKSMPPRSLSPTDSPERVLKFFTRRRFREKERKTQFLLLFLFPRSLSSPTKMASAPAAGSAATKEAIKRVLVVIGEKA